MKIVDEKPRCVAHAATQSVEIPVLEVEPILGKGVVMQASEDSVAPATTSGWEHIDVALRSIVKQRGLLDVNEAKWIREALRVKIWREVGCVSMIDYMDRRLGYAPRTASDRIRVASTLEELPKLAAALGNGLPYSAARELTRVATNENGMCQRV